MVASARRRKARIAIALLAVLTVAPSAAEAHPLHTTFVELSFNSQSRVVTATVKVFADDFLKRAARGTSVTLNDDAKMQQLAAAYLNTTLALTSQTGQKIQLRFCGWKRSADLIFICMSGPSTTGAAGMNVRDAILTDVFGDQVNVLQAEYGGQRHSVLFMAGTTARQLPR